MARGPTRPWRALAPHTRRMLPVVQAVLSQVGYEHPAEWKGCPDADDALQCQRGIYNAAAHLGVSAQCEITRSGGRYKVTFTLYDKRRARVAHVRRYGSDRTRWPYNPRQKGMPDGQSQT